MNILIWNMDSFIAGRIRIVAARQIANYLMRVSQMPLAINLNINLGCPELIDQYVYAHPNVATEP